MTDTTSKDLSSIKYQEAELDTKSSQSIPDTSIKTSYSRTSIIFQANEKVQVRVVPRSTSQSIRLSRTDKR